jgi:TldD protein
VDGCWGFAATRTLTPDGCARARAGGRASPRPTASRCEARSSSRPPPAYPNASWKSPYTIDPFDPLEEKVAYLSTANAEAMKVPGARFVNSVLFFVKEERLRQHEGSVIDQTIIRSWPRHDRTAVAPTSATSHARSQRGRSPWDAATSTCSRPTSKPRRAWGRGGEAEKLKAKPVEVGRYDLILTRRNLWLTIHESIAHPTELDRAMGYEANYAGTSFIAPPEEKLGKLRTARAS